MTRPPSRRASAPPSGATGGIPSPDLTEHARIQTPPAPVDRKWERSDSIYVLTDDPLPLVTT